MEDSEFTVQFKQLVQTYRDLTAQLEHVADAESRQHLMQQIQENVRQQNALRRQHQPKETS